MTAHAITPVKGPIACRESYIFALTINRAITVAAGPPTGGVGANRAAILLAFESLAQASDLSALRAGVTLRSRAARLRQSRWYSTLCWPDQFIGIRIFHEERKASNGVCKRGSDCI